MLDSCNHLIILMYVILGIILVARIIVFEVSFLVIVLNFIK